MKHIRTYLTGLLAAVLLLCLLPQQAEAAGVSFSGSGSVRADNSVTVTLSISGSGVYGVSAKLSYDTSRLTLTGVKQLVGSSWFVDISGGNLVAYDQKLSSPVSGGLLAVTFQVKSGLSAGTELRASFTDVVASDQNGQEQALGSATWTASVAAPLSSDCRLSSLGCDAALSPAFSPDVTQYSLTVPYSVTRLTLQYRTADSGADVSISGNQLSVGSNTVVLTVTAADGSTRRYTLSVTRQPDPNAVLSSDATLAKLEPSTGQLSPAFDPEITEYVLYLPWEVSRLTLSATAHDGKALNVTRPGSTTLKEGDNLITITCTAENGSTLDYLVHVYRMPLFAGTLPQIGEPEPEPEEQQPVEPEPEEPGPFQAAWAALLAPVDLSSLPLLQGHWLPLYAFVIAALVLVLLLIFFLGRASGVAAIDRRGRKLWAKMEAHEAQLAAEQAAEAEPEPEPVTEGEPAPQPELPTPEPEPEPAAEPDVKIDLPAALTQEPATESEPVPEPGPEESNAEAEPGKSTLDRMALDELLDEIKNMQM